MLASPGLLHPVTYPCALLQDERLQSSVDDACIATVGRRGSDSAAAGVSKRAKLPAKNPMVLQKQNGSYYRVRVLKEETHRVKIGKPAA